MLDTSLLDTFINELVNSQCKKQYLLAFNDLVHMYEDMMYILTQCVTQDKDMRLHLLQDKVALKQIIMLLGISYQGILHFISVKKIKYMYM